MLQRRAGCTHHVQAAGDEHGVVLPGQVDGASTRLLDGAALDHLVTAQFLGSARQLGCRQTTGRGRSACQDHIELGGPQCRQHLAGVTPPQASHHQQTPAGRIEVFEEDQRRRIGARWVVGPINDDQRLVAHDLETARHDDLGEPFAHHIVNQWGREERLDGGQCCGGVVGLMPAVQGHEHPRVHGGGGTQIDHSPTQGQLVLDDVEVLAAQELHCTTGVDEDLHQIGFGLADDHSAAGLDDARLLASDVGLGGAGVLVVVHGHVGHDCDLCLAHVGGIPAAQQADLDHSDIDGDVGKPSERRCGDGLEVRRAHACNKFQLRDGVDLLGEVVVGDGLGVTSDALVQPFEVRAGVRTHCQAVRHQQPGDHLRGRALAVGARDVDGRVQQLRVAHDADQSLHALQRG